MEANSQAHTGAQSHCRPYGERQGEEEYGTDLILLKTLFGRGRHGRLLDVTGWTEEAVLKRYGITESHPLRLSDGHLSAPLANEFERELIERVIHALPDLVSISWTNRPSMGAIQAELGLSP